MKARDYKDATDLVAYSIREDAKANTFSATPLEVSTSIGALRPSVQSHHAQTFVVHGTQDPCVSDIAFAQGRNNGGENVLFQNSPQAVDVYNQCIDGDTAATLTEACGGSNTSGPKLMHDRAVRRLTPIECERLQGFADNFTNIPWRGKPESPDGLRYKALGNSMAVPVMKWIGERISLNQRA